MLKRDGYVKRGVKCAPEQVKQGAGARETFCLCGKMRAVLGSFRRHYPRATWHPGANAKHINPLLSSNKRMGMAVLWLVEASVWAGHKKTALAIKRHREKRATCACPLIILDNIEVRP